MQLVSRDSGILSLTLIISLILSLISVSLILCWDSPRTCHRLSETLQQTLLISNLLCHRLCQTLCCRFCTDYAQNFPRILRDFAINSILLPMLDMLCSDSAQTNHRTLRIRFTFGKGLHELRNIFQKLKLCISFSMLSSASIKML